MINEFLILDIETTGFEKKTSEIIDFAVLHFSDFKIKNRFETLIKSNKKLPKIISDLTGIDDEMLETAPNFDDIHQDIQNSIIPDIPIIGHNISFDIDFLLEKGFELNNPRLDTLLLSRFFYPKFYHFNLSAVSSCFNISIDGAHRAMNDVEINLNLFLQLQKEVLKFDDNFFKINSKIIKKSPKVLQDFFRQEDNDNYKKNFINLNNEINVVKKDEKIVENFENIFADEKNKIITCNDNNSAKKSLLYFASNTESKDIGFLAKDSFSAYKTAFDCAELSGFFPNIFDNYKNFLCNDKLDMFLNKEKFNEEEALFLMKIKTKMQNNKNNFHVGSFELSNAEMKFWKMIAAKKEQNKMDFAKKINNFAIFNLDVFLRTPSEKLPNTLIFENIDILLSTGIIKKSIDIKNFEMILIFLEIILSKKYKKKIDSIKKSFSLFWAQSQIFARITKDPEKILYSQTIKINSRLTSLPDFEKMKEKKENLKKRLQEVFDFIPNFIKYECKRIIDKLDLFFDKSIMSWILLYPSGDISLFYSRELNNTLLKKIHKKKLILYGENLNNATFDIIKNNISKFDKLDFSKKRKVKISYRESHEDEKMEAIISEFFEKKQKRKTNFLVLFSSVKDMDLFAIKYKKKINDRFFSMKDLNNENIKNIVSKNNNIFVATFRNLVEDILCKIDFTDLIIAKVPFMMPQNPIEEMLAQKTGNAFINWTIPRTAFMTKKAIDIFVKSKSKQEIVFFDDRVFTRRYSKDFLKFFENFGE